MFLDRTQNRSKLHLHSKARFVGDNFGESLGGSQTSQELLEAS